MRKKVGYLLEAFISDVGAFLAYTALAYYVFNRNPQLLPKNYIFTGYFILLLTTVAIDIITYRKNSIKVIGR